MKTLLLNVWFVPVLFAFSFSLQAQNYDSYASSDSYANNYSNANVGPSQKVVNKMQELKNTYFMQAYKRMQIEIEETIKMVKSNEHLYSSEDVYQIKVAYRTTALEFNRVLTELKKDLAKGKYRAKNSVYFHRDLERKHRALTQFYQTHFKNPIEGIMQGETASIEE